MMKKSFTFIITLTLALLLLGCQKPSGEYYVPKETQAIDEVPEEPEAVSPEELVEESEADLFCTHNDNCTWGEHCIEGRCQILADFYKTEDDGECKKCNFNNIEILTSDGETYTLSRGQGSYTAAGALDWTILSGPDYCSGEEIIVPIEILKRNYGEIFSDEVIMLKVGETSDVITHPIVQRVAFTLTVISANEVCS